MHRPWSAAWRHRSFPQIEFEAGINHLAVNQTAAFIVGYCHAWSASYASRLKAGEDKRSLDAEFRQKAIDLIPTVFADGVRHPSASKPAMGI